MLVYQLAFNLQYINKILFYTYHYDQQILSYKGVKIQNLNIYLASPTTVILLFKCFIFSISSTNAIA